jgi:DNA end-binding protein Ku
MLSIWNCSLLINGLEVPVKLLSATQNSRPVFEMVDSRDMAKIRNIHTNEKTGIPVPQAYIGKSYGEGENKILVSPEMIESCLPTKSNQLIFNYFVDLMRFPSHYVDTFYYLDPVAGDELNYALLLEGLSGLYVAGIAQATFLNTCALFALVPLEGKLVLYKLRFDAMILPFPVPVLPPLTESHAAIMNELTAYMAANTDEFDVSAYKDTFAEDFYAAVAA